MNHCLALIKNKYTYLTNAEKKVADYILKNRAEVVSLSISELARRADVAPSAVIRFCRSIGYQGYAECKLALSAELTNTNCVAYDPEISYSDDIETITKKVFSASMRSLSDTSDMIDYGMVGRAVDAIEHADTVYIFGLGTSAPIASDAAYRMMQFGIRVFYSPDPITMRVATANITSADAAVGISHSGRTRPVLDTLRLARESGAVTICVTSFVSSPVFRVSDIPICVYSDEIMHPMEAISSRIAHISVLDAITAALYVKNRGYSETRTQVARRLVGSFQVGEKEKLT